MLKHAIILLLTILSFQSAQAQQDTLLYYLKNTGEIVDDKASADYFVLITKPNNDSGGLFPVYGYYPDGKRKFIAASKVQSIDFVLEGGAMQFFPNGRRKAITSYSNGAPTGNETQYYPNGKIYTLTQYDKNFKHLLTECRDSTGTVLAQNGEGKWLKFDDDFKQLLKEGSIAKGLEHGEWHETVGDSIKRTFIYNKGVVKSGVSYKSGKEYPFKESFVNPYSKNPSAGFLPLIKDYMSNSSYKEFGAKETNIAITFMVESDGSITDIKIKSGSFLTAVSASQKGRLAGIHWEPGLYYGIPTRMQASYSPVITTGIIAVPSSGPGGASGPRRF